MLKKIITAINMTIVTILLVPLYFVVIGFAFLLQSFSRKKGLSDKTFWKSFQVAEDVSSPY